MTAMTTLDALTRARSLIADPMHWTTWVRKECRPTGLFRYCALGALDEALGSLCDDCRVEVHPAVTVLATLVPDDMELRQFGSAPNYLVAMYNNLHSHADVLALFDRAIERARTLDALRRVGGSAAHPDGVLEPAA